MDGRVDSVEKAHISKAAPVMPLAIVDSGLRADVARNRGLTVVAARSFVDDSPLSDSYGHGTSMALAADTTVRNTTGCALPLIIAKAMDETGSGAISNVISSLKWLCTQELSVVLMPFGTDQADVEFEACVAALFNKGVGLVAPVGNIFSGQRAPLYPARWNEVYSVGISENSNAYCFWSNQPDTVLDTDRLKISCNIGLEHCSGTSMAAAIVAANVCVRRSAV